MSFTKRLRAGKGIIAAIIALASAFSKCAGQDTEQSDSDASFLSRVTVELPVYTRHLPNDTGFNDHNWGAFINIDVARASALGDAQLSIDGGDFTNSYFRNTAFLAGEITWTILSSTNVKVDSGPMLGFDLNGGYKGYSTVDPLLGGLQIKIGGTNFSPEYDVLNRLGAAITVIPGQETALNLALTVRL